LQAGGLERQSRQSRQSSGQVAEQRAGGRAAGRWQSSGQVAEQAEQAEQAADRLERRASWSGGQATGRSIQAVAKTGRGRPIMTEIIGAGKFRAS